MRLKELDAFRGIAALAVVLYHYTTRYNELFNTSSVFEVKYGWLGVPFFFILSGFVITLTINRSSSPSEFLFKRFIRLYPTYWIGLLLTLFVVYIAKLNEQHPIFDYSFQDVLMNFTMFHQFFNFSHVDGAYWSLLPELLFYLLMAFLLHLGKINQIFIYNSFLIILCIVHYFIPLPIIGKILDLHYVLLFMIGIIFYKIYTGSKGFGLHLLIVINLLVGVFLYQVQQPTQSLILLFFSFSLIVVTFYAFTYKKLRFFGKIKPLVFLGTISYPLYLIHQNIGYAVMDKLDEFASFREANLLIAIVISIVLSSIITFTIEPPLKSFIYNLKNKSRD